MVTQKFDLNMIPGKPKPIIRASQYDTGLRVFEVSLFAGTDTYTIPSGATLTVQGTKPDYTGFSYSATYSGNTVTFDCTDQMTACAGAVEMEIAVVNEGKRVATANFVLQVEPAALKDDTIISETDIPIIEQLPEMMEDVNTLISTFGGPNVAETAAEMTDQDKVYVYIGSETGYNSGHWYYYDKTAHVWKDGGIYQSAGVEVDNTLSIGGMAADAKATGDALALKADIASPTFTGYPKAPTASLISYNTQIANTEFVQRLVLPLDDAVNGLEPTEIEMHLVVDGTTGTWAQGGKTNIYDLLPGDNVEVTAGERDAYLVWYTTQGGSEAVNVSTSHTVTAGATRRWGTTDARKLAVLMEDTSGNDVSPASFTINGVEKGLNERVDALETTKQDTLTFDTTPTEGSTNPVTSGGAWEAVETKADQAELAEVETVTVVEVGTPTTRDILSELTWTEGRAMGPSGVLIEASTLRYSNKIAVSEGDKIDLVRPGGTAEARFICAFGGDTAVQAKGAENVTEYTVPEGIDSIVISTYLPASPYSPSAIYLTALTYIKQNIYKNDIDALNTSVDAISEVVTVEDYTEESNRGETPVFTTGFMNNAGVISTGGSSAYFEYSQKIAVQPGDVVSTLSNGKSYPMRFVCAYNGDIVISASGSSDDTYTYTVPDGIDGVVVTARKSTNIDTINVFHQEAAKSAYVKPTPMGYMMKQGTLADGESMTLPYHNVKNGNVYIFNANIGTLGKIRFVKESSFYIEVDATNLIIVNDQNTYTIPHGLTIVNNITLMVCNETAATVSFVKVSSDGQEFSYTTSQRFLMDSGTPTILSTGSALSECTFSWVSKNINAPIWLFGDSYFSWYNTRWTYYLARDGYTKDCMLNGYAGEASAAAYDALENLLSVTRPKIVVWCMGMNDGDSATEVNANWKKYYDKLINMSKKYGFEIVLYTVPTTSEVNNTFKDAIIRESGYRYIEADKAVRIDSSGNWVPGALDTDNVHPTEIGAKILYHRILADLPEIMCNY